MSTELRDRLRTTIAALPDPHTEQPLGDAVRAVAVDGDRAAIEIVLGYPAAGWHASLAEQARAAALTVAGIAQATVEVSSRIAAHRVQKELTPMPEEIGRASCRARLCQYVEISVVPGSLNKKHQVTSTPPPV